MLFRSSWRAAPSVATLIPLALLFAFIRMHARVVSANLISPGAVGFGSIIDRAIVPVEALMVRLSARWVAGLAHPSALSKAITRLALASIFTFQRVEGRIFTFQRVEGRIFTPVALTLSFALLGSAQCRYRAA